MMLRTRSRLAGGLASALAAAGLAMAVVAPGAFAAFEVASFQALTCTENAPENAPKECSVATPSQFFKQAGGHPNFGITDFAFNEADIAGNGIRSIRTDVPVGVSTNPQALPQCSLSDFEANLGKVEESHCNANTEAGTQELTIALPGPTIVTLTGKVYNLDPAVGLPLEFGIDIPLPLFLGGAHVHSLLEGGVSWHKEAEATEAGIESGDYHEFFKLKIGKSLAESEPPLLRSRLIFNGKAGSGLVTNPTACPGPQTTHLRVESYDGSVVRSSFTTSITSQEENCAVLKFEPAFALLPSTTQTDQPDGITTELKFPVNESSSETENSDLKKSEVVLPEGLTLNPAAGQGLDVCTPEQIGIGSEKPISCPSRSAIGTVVLDVPGLPPGSLTGNVYLGEKVAGPITGPPYIIYLDAESSRYGQAVRLEGTVVPDASTGRLTATFDNNPQGPFRDLKLSFNSGALAPIANPLVCGPAKTETRLVPYSGTPAQLPFSSFTIDGNGKGGACASPLPFALTQSTEDHPPGGGEAANFTLNLARPDGNQYLARASTKLPLGLVGKIPAVPLCPEPNAAAGTCPVASQIGKVAATVGSGPTPARFEGPVYLTGPTEKAPYGMTMVVNAAVGPFSLGNDVVRTRIEVEPYTARVVVAGNVPTIFKGIPLRLKALSVAINRQGFLLNPTNCGALATESTLSSSGGATQTVSTPFAVTGCSGLAFKPKFGAETSGKTSRANGASLIVHVNRPKGIEANIKSVLVTVPRHMPSRLSTLNHACREAVFAANPANCPANSKVGTARIKTPVLPGQLSGPAYFVSHGGAKFPDLDLVVSGSGVTVIMVGNTNISNGITTTRFAALPDVPFSGFELKLPQGPNSALGANGNLCRQSLVMPTTIVAQNGKTIKQNTRIAVKGCPVSVVFHFVRRHQAVVVAHAPAAGRVSGSGPNLRFVTRHTGRAGNVTLFVPLSNAGARNLAARGRLAVRVRIGFLPKNKRERASVAFTTVVF